MQPQKNKTIEIRMSGDQLRVTWQWVGKVLHDEIVSRLRAIRGVEFDRDAKVWTAPVDQADRLLAAFPKASYDYDALCAAFDRADERVGIFGQSLLDMGVRLVVVDGRVFAQGAGVSPLLQQLVDERGEALRAWLASDVPVFSREHARRGDVEVIRARSINNCASGDSTASSKVFRQAELFAASLQNSGRNQYQEEAMHQRRRRRKRTV